MKTVNMTGTVFSGEGEGARFMELPWVTEQIEEKLGFTPYPGTLNLKLSREGVKNRSLLQKTAGMQVSLSQGFHTGRIFEASLREDVECGIVIPQIPNYPQDVIEVIASTNLREKLGLEDGDHVEIRIRME